MNRPADNPLQAIDALLAANDLAGAAAISAGMIASGSTRLSLHFLHATVCLKLGRYREAEDSIHRAASLSPAAPGELVELARRLMYFNLSGDLVAVAARMIDRPSWHAPAEADFAAMLSMAGEQVLATRLLDRSIALAGAGPARLYNRSQMRLYSGRLAEAEEDLRQCLRQDPGMAKAHWALSKLGKSAVSDDELLAMQRLATKLPPGSQDEVYLRFAQFNRLDQAGRHADAWQALARGCEAKRKLVAYDGGKTQAFFEGMKMAFPVGVALPAARPMPGPTPIFIVGMHRSGTTLLERLLGNHSQVSEGGELYDFPAQLRRAVGHHFGGPSDQSVVAKMPEIDFADVGQRYLAQVAWRAHGRPFLIDKLPSNFINLGFIRRALPQARVIHMRRNPMDTCFSNLKELFSNACPYSYDQGELAGYYGLHHDLVGHWQQVFPGFVLDVSYESLARDPEAEARRILAFCGLDWEPGCVDVGGNTRAVNTASSAQVREPIHQRGIEAWRRYEPWLGSLHTQLAAQGLL